jgi:glutamine cyclotransferase
MSDGTENLYFIDTATLQVKRNIQVYDNMGPVTELNELEFVDGLVYANIYCTDNIVAIDPKNGKVMKIIDMRNLLDVSKLTRRVDVLNGIAYQKATGKWFVTGKLWPTMFQVEFVQK